MERQKILIVEDDADISALLVKIMEGAGYQVRQAFSGTEALFCMERELPDCVLLDLMLPGMTGEEVLEQIRQEQKKEMPVLILSAKVSVQDKVKLLRLGADDYITKPFSMDELFARVQAHLRREKRSSHKSRGHFTRELIIDYSQRTVIIKNKKIDFSNKEFEIIKLLSMNAGQIFDREKIYEVVWGFEANGDSAVIKEHIRKIRMKLARYSENEYLETVWGVGYRWKK